MIVGVGQFGVITAGFLSQSMGIISEVYLVGAMPPPPLSPPL